MSIAAVAANLYIAQKSRQSSLELEAAKLTLKRLEAATDAIKELEIEGELLRIRCWELINLVSRLSREPVQGVKRQQELIEIGTRKFTQQADAFLLKWAVTRTDLPHELVQIVRFVRHECRGLIDSVLMFCASMRGKRALDQSRADDLCFVLRDLLARLDHFILMVAPIRRHGDGTVRDRSLIDSLSKSFLDEAKSNPQTPSSS